MSGTYEVEQIQNPSSIIIEPYNAAWPDLYNQEVLSLRRIAAFHCREFQHVGSTGVAGLASKPVIDILLAIWALDPADSYIEVLKPFGYIYRDVQDSGRHFFERYDEQKYHLHITQKDSWHYWRLILFRDRLQRDPEIAREYVALKQKLARTHSSDRAAYSGAKGHFVSRVTLEELEKNPGLEELFHRQATAIRLAQQAKR